VCEALDSVHAQNLDAIDLVVVDDASTDRSLEVALDWMQRHAARFGRLRLLRHRANSGLGFTRNSGFAAARTRFVLPLDADNRLLPACTAACLHAIEASGAAFAYPSVQKFGDEEGKFSDLPYVPLRFAAGNFIDATALIRLAAWAAAGGYDHVRFGWEDYDFWCRIAERGGFGQPVPETLVEYRVHHRSMLRETTDEVDNKQALIYDMQRRHPWILRHMGLETSGRANT
jgi:glycosyltransferase involved in cell wall biosynthesis